MLTEKDFSQMQNYIIQILPQLLRQQPEIATTIEGILAHQFPKRDEFARMLDEIKLLREDMDLRFEAQNKDMDRRFEAQNKDMARRFEAMDRRFELMEQKFEAMREDMDRRFELMEHKFEALREDIDQRFELMEHKFEALREDIDQRFVAFAEEIDRRFVAFAEEMDRRFEAQRKETEQRFDEQHRDILELKRRMIKVESTVDRMDKRITKFEAWLKITTGNVGDEKGQVLEQLFALGLSYGLKDRDILPETIQLRQQFVDTDGLIYLRKGKYIEIDLIAENGKFTVFEVKASAVETDVAIFARKVKLIQLQNPEKSVHGIFISPGASNKVKQCCTEYDLELLD